MRYIIAAAVIMAATPAIAEEIPRFDVDGYCTGLFPDSQSMTLVCLKSQQESYNALKPVWSQIPAAIRDHCTELFPDAYKMVEVCVEKEMESAQANESFEFKF